MRHIACPDWISERGQRMIADKYMSILEEAAAEGWPANGEIGELVSGWGIDKQLPRYLARLYYPARFEAMNVGRSNS